MSIVALTSDTLVASPGAGQIEYNGQFYGTDSNASRAQMQRLVQATSQASTSGTSIDFTGLPAWVKRITVMFNGVSTNGTSSMQLQLGTSGGVQTTSYSSGAWTANTNNTTSTTGMVLLGAELATYVMSGQIVLTLFDSATGLWVSSSNLNGGAINGLGSVGGGTKTLSGTLDRVRITTVNGTDTFDAGSINILYEG